MAYQSFEDLEVWKKARELKLQIAALVKNFPSNEKYRLTDQLIRSSRSVNTQLAEGHGRKTWPDRLRFSVIARGSLSETLNHLIDARDEEKDRQNQDNREHVVHRSAMASSYMRRILAAPQPRMTRSMESP